MEGAITYEKGLEELGWAGAGLETVLSPSEELLELKNFCRVC